MGKRFLCAFLAVILLLLAICPEVLCEIKLKLYKKLLRVKITDKPAILSTRDLLLKITGKDLDICHICSKGRIVFSSGLHPPCKAI
ncbi:MAG: hypothetical protein FWE27_09630 [Defluviitaleaceae bacterium]|nr:hypothetical protein [Defluviitaleaceae bacterium]